MKRRIIAIWIITVFCVPALWAEEPSPCAGIDLNRLRQHSPIPSAEIVSKRDMGGLCEVILALGGEFVPVYAGKDFMIAGEMLQHRKQVTQEQIDRLKGERFRNMLPELETLAAITYAPQKPTGRTIYMITDPLCPYCNLAAERIQPLADTFGVTVRALLYSVHGTAGEEKGIQAICRNFTLPQYAKKEWKEMPTEAKDLCAEGAERMDKTKETLSRLGIVGVPVFILDDGRFVSGANMAQVETLLQEQKGGGR